MRSKRTGRKPPSHFRQGRNSAAVDRPPISICSCSDVDVRWKFIVVHIQACVQQGHVRGYLPAGTLRDALRYSPQRMNARGKRLSVCAGHSRMTMTNFSSEEFSNDPGSIPFWIEVYLNRFTLPWVSMLNLSVQLSIKFRFCQSKICSKLNTSSINAKTIYIKLFTN